MNPFYKSQPESETPADEAAPRLSRLPRRVSQNVSVAELVKKYQDFLPAQGIHDLAQTAFAPKALMSESEQEYPSSSQLAARPALRSKSRHRTPARKPSTSDFEQGYAANVAPKYLTRNRRPISTTNGSRIPGPKGPVADSHESSRRASPEKRYSNLQGKEELRPSRPSSPPNTNNRSTSTKYAKNRVVSRPKDKVATRPTASTLNKSTIRRPPAGQGNKVSNIAKHFERLGRDAERSKGNRYAVIRGKRARPVAFTRAKVEVLDSVKDAIRDDSESSDSSEADDEDEGNDEDQASLPSAKPDPSELTSSDPAPYTAPPAQTFPVISVDAPDNENGEATIRAPPGQISLPSSPFLSSMKTKSGAPLTPPASDVELAGYPEERPSLLKTLSGFWPQPSRQSIEGEDLMSDPEHIFRDSSMVVRLDEPTSIIALALK